MIDANLPPYRIGYVLIDGFPLMSYAAAIEPFRAANVLAQRQLYRWSHIPADGSVALTSTGASVPADRQIGGAEDFDLLLVVAGGDPLEYQNPRLFSWLRKLARRGIVLGGVSGGPALLARAGLMRGYRMTVHWEHADALNEVIPDLALLRELYVMDRDRFTCAGGVAPLDMMHKLIAQHHGAEFARQVSDWFLHTDIRPAAGPQRAGIVERFGVSSAVVTEAIEHMQNHLADPLSLRDLSRLVNRTPRQLNRVFRSGVDASTMDFYRGLRLEHARRLLSQTSLSVTEIAYSAGFASGAHFSQKYRQKYGHNPRAERARQK